MYSVRLLGVCPKSQFLMYPCCLLLVIYFPPTPTYASEGGRAATYQRDMLQNSRGALVSETWDS